MLKQQWYQKYITHVVVTLLSSPSIKRTTQKNNNKIKYKYQRDDLDVLIIISVHLPLFQHQNNLNLLFRENDDKREITSSAFSVYSSHAEERVITLQSSELTKDLYKQISLNLCRLTSSSLITWLPKWPFRCLNCDKYSLHILFFSHHTIKAEPAVCKEKRAM